MTRRQGGGRFAGVLFIAASLLPWRVAFACAHEPILIQQRCCCHGLQPAGHCPQTGGDSPAPCCEVVFVAAGLLADEPDLAPPSGFASKSPPALVGAPDPRLVTSSVVAVTRLADARPVAWHSGTRTYLETARLRL